MHARLVRSAAAGVAVLTLLVPATTAAATAKHVAQTPRPGAAPAEGEFVATVDFASLKTREVRGNKCEFTVNGTLTVPWCPTHARKFAVTEDTDWSPEIAATLAP